MTRVVVRNSVDMRLLAMQLHKLKVCEQAISDGRKPDKPTLELEDLVRLFGFLQHDADGNVIGVEADYDDSNENDEAEASVYSEDRASDSPKGPGDEEIGVDAVEDGLDGSTDVDVNMVEDDGPDGSVDREVNMVEYEEETGSR